MRVILLFLLSIAVTAIADGFCSFDFSKDQGIDLKNDAEISDGVLCLHGESSFASVPNSKNYSFAEQGGTLSMVCRLRSLDKSGMHFLASKGDSFLFGITGGKYNFSLCQDGRWSIALIGGNAPATDTWIHLAAVAERVDEPEQSNFGFKLSIYVNGEKILGKFVQCRKLISSNEAAFIIGTPSKNTHVDGDYASVAFYDRALSPSEIEKEAKSSPLVKITHPGLFDPSEEYLSAINTLEEQADCWQKKAVCATMRKAANTGLSTAVLMASMPDIKRALADAKGDDVFDAVNAVQKSLVYLRSGKSMLCMVYGNTGHAFPVIDLYDELGRSIFGERSCSWNIILKSNGQSIEFNDFDDSVELSIDGISKLDEDYVAKCAWIHPKFKAESTLLFNASGLSIDFMAKSNDMQIEQVRFPIWSFAQKEADVLAAPSWSGQLFENPTDGVSIEREFPCAQSSMQFYGYYGKDKDGVYVAMEDPHATSRGMAANGSHGQLAISWTTRCPQIPDAMGNQFSLGCFAVVRPYRGEWFQAAMLYKDFLEKKSEWWIKDLPRTSTPQWMRDNSIWILAGVYPSQNQQTLLELRDYFEMPFGVHLVSTTPERIWPHYARTSQRAHEMRTALQAKGLRILPYCDPRLWREKDSEDGKTDLEYDTTAQDYCIKRADGTPYIEFYGKDCKIMCPADKRWHKRYSDIINQIAEQGFDGAYHDQLPCGHFVPCYDKSHGHLPGDPSFWVAGGYWPMYDALLKGLKGNYPDFVHTGEDASDPYLQCLDGYTCWRWTEPNLVPMFQSIYSGRIQFTGKLYNHQYPGDTQSNYSKAAMQMVNAEQLGWITLEDLRDPTPFRRFFKSLAWIRKSLLEYFNEGERMAPMDFAKKPERVTSAWGNEHANGLMVCSDAIEHSVWRLKDGRIMAVFVNTTEQLQSAEAAELPFGKNALRCTADLVSELKDSKLTIPPLSAEIWLVSDNDISDEAKKHAECLAKCKAFDLGPSLEGKRFSK